MLIRQTRTDLSEAISRELEYQVRRGMTPVLIEVSPEAHEVLRLLEKAPQGSRLTQHDGIQVSVNRKMIGPNAWIVRYREGAQATEAQRDRARQVGSPDLRQIIIARR